MNPYVMRPSTLEDFDDLMELAQRSGPGFTSLPVDEELIRERLEKSDKAFKGNLKDATRGKYLMMMENVETGEVAGCSAVKAGIGHDQPFFNYRVITLAQASPVSDRRFDMDALVLSNDFTDYTEVGTLFLKSEHRGGGVGRLAAQSRYLLMAAAPERFGDMVLAELRGVVDKEGNTPFWEHLGQHFFRMDFKEADHLSAVTDSQFILDLMPRHPIYVDLLPEAARAVIGECHEDGIGAMKLLEWEGFRYQKVVDIFDGGPLVAAPRERIRTINDSRRVSLVSGKIDESKARKGLVATDALPNFRVSMVEGQMDGDGTFIVPDNIFDKLQMKPGQEARIWLRGA